MFNKYMSIKKEDQKFSKSAIEGCAHVRGPKIKS